MASKSVYLKIPSRNQFQKRRDFSRQGMLLSRNTNTNNNPSSIDVLKANVSPLYFESVLETLYPNSTKKGTKSQRKYFKSTSHAEISQLKFKIQLENKKRQQKSLKSLLFSRPHSLSERENKSSEKRLLKRPLRQNSLQFKLNLQQRINNLSPGQILKEESSRNLLESTNFSIRAISCLNGHQQKQLQRNKINSSQASLKKRQVKTSFRPHLSQSKQISSEQQSLMSPQKQKIAQQSQIEIKLSIKSMVKSQQGEISYELQKTNISVPEQIKNLQILQKQQINTRPTNEKKPIFTTRNYKHNRLVIKFDKRLLLSANEINDPCLKIGRINTVSSRVKTQPNL